MFTSGIHTRSATLLFGSPVAGDSFANASSDTEVSSSTPFGAEVRLSITEPPNFSPTVAMTQASSSSTLSQTLCVDIVLCCVRVRSAQFWRAIRGEEATPRRECE